MSKQYLRCPSCRGQKTIMGSGGVTRKACTLCNGTGKQEYVADPIGELEKLKAAIGAKQAEVNALEDVKPAEAVKADDVAVDDFLKADPALKAKAVKKPVKKSKA